MFVLALASLALAGPRDSPPPPIVGPMPTPIACSGSSTDPTAPQPPECLAGGSTSSIPVCGGCPPPIGATITAGPPTYTPTLILPKRIHAGERVEIWAREEVQGTFCYSDGSSRVGCASSNLGAWHVVVRPGRVQYFVFKSNGHVYDRRVYRNGKLVGRT